MKQSFTDDTINELKIGQKMRQKNRNNKKRKQIQRDNQQENKKLIQKKYRNNRSTQR